ncbi:isoprenylcysteine carboxylmethyltransferase family protein [Thalassospira sp. HF15]|uniref:methyltransferase family protein n=1 Tax=Thalassospira sp. HF15 TaxID=2722755 RepID=UPI00142FF18A|nr:isoprenylcysteine carboxylmethyltransferase family protein [Thalassospira sp. HF15]NIY76881.1 isoprenylcysteine carboxylmethyltransferase family protein [Thalassospira sp. HF15]
MYQHQTYPTGSSCKTASGVADPDRLQRVQRRRKRTLRVGAGVLLGLVCFARAGFDRSSQWHDSIEALGIIAIMVCIVGRSWCALYIGGRKKTSLVTLGPYSISRNPLYVFSFIGAFGAGAQTGSLVIAGLFALGCWLVFRGVVAHEETMLAARFDASFDDYRQTVPRFGPNLMKWRDAKDLVVKPHLFLVTLRDACWFLLAVPVCEGIKLFQDQGRLIALISLP